MIFYVGASGPPASAVDKALAWPSPPPPPTFIFHYIYVFVCLLYIRAWGGDAHKPQGARGGQDNL